MTLSTLFLKPAKHSLSTAQIMLLVLIACIPGIAAMSWFFGAGVLLNILWLMLCALAIEAAILIIRKKPVLQSLGDFSALVTALLLALSMPPASPWWLGLIGIFFAIAVAKHLYGGLGYNPFNPAMVGYAVLLIAYPLEMTRWLLPENVNGILPELMTLIKQFLGNIPETMDAFVGATALDQFKLDRGGLTIAEYWQGNPLFGSLSGAGWEWVNAGFLLGGLYMLYRKIITWHIPAAMLGTMAIMALFFYDGGSSASHGSPLFHLFGGAAMLGAFFIATDPVSGPATNKAKVLYGILIGMLIYSIRVWGAYPDGVAFAVLLGNFAAPAIDYFLRQQKQEDDTSHVE
ncbi:MAG: RnfABCDGE type electron transport complex subunit D [Gammaproteobacteria bacterium]|nr:RnfABCDGE type electron transport complex subunit D [Gammaproteobacteria bacterium]